MKFFGKLDNLFEKYFNILGGGVFMVCANVIMVWVTSTAWSVGVLLLERAKGIFLKGSWCLRDEDGHVIGMDVVKVSDFYMVFWESCDPYSSREALRKYPQRMELHWKT